MLHFLTSCNLPMAFVCYTPSVIINMVVGRSSLLRNVRLAACKSHMLHVRACLLHRSLRRKPPFIYEALALHNATIVDTCQTTRYLLRSSYRASNRNEFVFCLTCTSGREFLAMFRLTRIQFGTLLTHVAQHPVILGNQTLKKKRI
jgi:hypothetical protein